MFPSKQSSDEFLSQISSIPHLEDIIEEDMILGQSQLAEGSSNLNKLMEKSQPSNTNDGNILHEQKKMMRKEIERQRRQQLSSLHASLRSLLPLESIKGKRSISDHMNEAVNYIKHLKNNIQELSVKRDKLKKLSDGSNPEHKSENSDNNLLNCITVRTHLDGVEIAISTGLEEESFLLSKVLEAVLEEGFDVISCVSTKKNERLFNTIQCQASHQTCIDVAGLQQKINDVMLSFSRFVSD